MELQVQLKSGLTKIHTSRIAKLSLMPPVMRFLHSEQDLNIHSFWSYLSVHSYVSTQEFLEVF
jgi:hypothetical protein